MFIAELNRRRREIWGAQTEKLGQLVGDALEALHAALQGEDSLAAAVHVLKAVGLYGIDLAPRGSEDATGIEREQELARLTRLDRDEAEEINRALARQDQEFMRTLAGL